MLTTLSNVFTNLNMTDMETGYKLFKREVINSINIKEKSFGVEPEITVKLAKKKYVFYLGPYVALEVIAPEVRVHGSLGVVGRGEAPIKYFLYLYFFLLNTNTHAHTHAHTHTHTNSHTHAYITSVRFLFNTHQNSTFAINYNYHS